MKLFEWLELGFLNIIGFISSAWLVSFFETWSAFAAGLVAISIVGLNAVKIYGHYLDNLKKQKELDE